MKALVARPGGFGDVLLTGPAVRAVATRATRVTMLCEADGAAAARLLPHVDDVVVWDTPQDGTDPPAEDTDTDTESVIRRLRNEAYDVALVLTSDGRCPLPTAELLRRARVGRVVADGTARAGGLLPEDRHRLPPGRHEAEAALDTATALGFALRAGDDGRLRVLPAPDTATLTGNGPYVVVHPGSGGPADAWDPERWAEAVALLADAGHRVVVTGAPEEAALTRRVGGDTAVDLGGRTTPRTLAGVLRSADVLVAGDTGPAHLAAAVGTPVVSLFSAAVKPAEHGAPYRVPTVPLGEQGLARVTEQDVVRAVRKLLC
ncbi:glycosyltransferase family 9 protein [Streptomyces sp. S.PNR 29]|uniref:glycosyltransferase family 9 protein n=1 Tax=Streptomyces sp. S.PNR 29 TaxID=2973805 RepID=UPI0025AF8091|nr:glycosyltransferase family 9 protein [Streptomyces sp. S.PNR 29]MDN0199801.1 glycosyltransferase family 9 protein [Streptomyces sp. S.PNR 29]